MGTFQVDKDGLIRDLKKYFLTELERIAGVIAKMYQGGIPAGKVPHGASRWRDMLAKDFGILATEMAEDAVKVTIGQPYPVGSREWMIAEVVDKGHVGEIWTRPGEQTLDDDMYWHTSTALTRYRLPQFEQTGVNFMNDSATVKRARTYFYHEMNHVVKNIPVKMITRHFHFR